MTHRGPIGARPQHRGTGCAGQDDKHVVISAIDAAHDSGLKIGGPGQVMIVHLLCDLLFMGDDEGDILILHHAPATDRMFLAWVLNHYGAEAIAPIWPSGYQTGSDPLPEKGQRQDAAGSLRSRTVRRTTDRNAWKHCIAWPAERARPARIRAATTDDPFCLYPDFAAAQGEVWHWNSDTKVRTVIPGADPASFCKVKESVGTDGVQICSGPHPGPFDPRKTRRDGFFLKDDALVFFAHRDLPLKGAGFRVLLAGAVSGPPFCRACVTHGLHTVIVHPDGSLQPVTPDG